VSVGDEGVPRAQGLRCIDQHPRRLAEVDAPLLHARGRLEGARHHETRRDAVGPGTTQDVGNRRQARRERLHRYRRGFLPAEQVKEALSEVMLLRLR
jgi:hypothetical protein